LLVDWISGADSPESNRWCSVRPNASASKAPRAGRTSRESSPDCVAWVGAYVTLGAFSEATQREVIDDEYPILLVPGLRVAQEIDRAAREAGLGGLKACLEAIDATYDKLVINRRPIARVITVGNLG